MLLLLLAVVALAGPPNAPDTTPDFAAQPAGVQLPEECDVARVQARLLAVVHAFNSGRGQALASNFTRRAGFQPYLGDVGRKYARRGLVDRRELSRFVRERYAAGDGWTAMKLLAPQGSSGLPATTVFGLRLAVSSPAGRVEGGTKIVVSCSSGLVLRWVGPVYSRPSS